MEDLQLPPNRPDITLADAVGNVLKSARLYKHVELSVTELCRGFVPMTSNS